MPLSDDIVKKAKDESDIAIVIIGRAAGEDRENKLKRGSYYLTKIEKGHAFKVTKHLIRRAHHGSNVTICVYFGL